MIQIVDYGMGNLRSVQKAFEKLGQRAEVCTDPEQIRTAERVILPGVGAFRDAIDQLHRRQFTEPLHEFLDSGRPLLGICLGLQLLFDVSFEDGEYAGLGVVPGTVVRFDPAPGLKIPHMGWNALRFEKENPLLAGIDEGAHVYFVHSYHVVPDDDSVVAARTEHGNPFVSMIARDNLFATQFHPEKSQSVGLKLLENFAKLPAVA